VDAALEINFKFACPVTMDNIFDVDGFQSDLNFPLMRADSFAILQ
tara:strand:- start:425 stop:559 length:135 start_codon:yes stop_codon:yes gene_type:complete